MQLLSTTADIPIYDDSIRRNPFSDMLIQHNSFALTPLFHGFLLTVERPNDHDLSTLSTACRRRNVFSFGTKGHCDGESPDWFNVYLYVLHMLGLWLILL